MYVGSSVNVTNRIKKHAYLLAQGKHYNQHLQRKWDKYGASDFKFMVLEECERTRLIEREQFWVSAITPSCNIAVPARGGMVGRKHSEDTRRKMRIAWESRSPASEETLRKMSISKSGKSTGPHSVETRKKMSESQKKRKPPTPETLRKISLAKLGTVASVETRLKMRLAHKRRKPISEETRKKRSDAMKQVWVRKRSQEKE